MALLAAGALTRVICVALRVYGLIMLVRVLMSWFPPPAAGPMRSVTDLVFDITEPALRPLRNIIPPVRTGMVALDVSPILVFVILAVLQQVICF